MVNENEMISSMEEKIERVIRFVEALKTQNGELQQQIGKLSGQVREKTREMEVLESKFQSLKLSKALTSSPEETGNVKLQVNRMVREIDKCIALLNR